MTASPPEPTGGAASAPCPDCSRPTCRCDQLPVQRDRWADAVGTMPPWSLALAANA